ncbi:uncharacterized protein LOC108682262 isoform X2 [Hyalella azteca]|uniref:Uncharacterized protein LOC108682262 isoform X2 n=1 Tax=Hyalella azteca TaxID=294128 RepID=A0A979FPP8_HYAAZ|nr:uncharacterized protein LOC108682262 isoform X2 [Hyalella azteca]
MNTMEVCTPDTRAESSPSPDLVNIMNMPVVAVSPSSINASDDGNELQSDGLSTTMDDTQTTFGNSSFGLSSNQDIVKHADEKELYKNCSVEISSSDPFPDKIKIRKVGNGTAVISSSVVLDDSKVTPQIHTQNSSERNVSTESISEQNSLLMEANNEGINDHDANGSEASDDIKGRFNLRKRKLMSGSYDGLGSYEVSGAGYTYDMQRITTALKAIRTTGCSIKQASIEYGIPRTSLFRYHQQQMEENQLQLQSSKEASPEPLSKDTSYTSIPLGGSAVNGGELQKLSAPRVSFKMSSTEECQLAAYVSLLSRSGKCLSYSDIKVIAEHIVRSCGKGKPKSRSQISPTSGWIQKFRLRHPELNYKTLEHSSMKLGEPSRGDLLRWQNDLESFLKVDWKLDPPSMFSEECASRIYTCDEILIAFSKLDNKGEKVPLKSLLNSSSNEEKQLVTVIAAASASGDYLKPFFLSPSTAPDFSKFPTLDTSTYHAVPCSSGLVTPEIFMQWMINFEAHLTSKNIPRPVVLLMDDHAAHFHIGVFLYCLDKQIIPVCLPPRLNKLLQPLLGNFFPKLMMAYQACCKRYSAKTGEVISHACFPYVMMKAWTLVTKPKFVIDGFRSCNLIPMTVTQLAPPASPSQEAKIPTENDAVDLVKVKSESAELLSEDCESSSVPDETPLNAEAKSAKNTLARPFKKCKLSKPIGSSQSNGSAVIPSSTSHTIGTSSATREVPAVKPTAACSTPSQVLLGDNLVSDERRTGRREGIEICFSVLESFVPADILPVWRQRSASHTGTCEIGYCMWKAVQLLSKGGVDMLGKTQPQVLQHTGSTPQQ